MVRMDSLSSVPPHIQPPMAQVPSAIRELIRLVPAMFMYSSMLILLFSLIGDRHISGQPACVRDSAFSLLFSNTKFGPTLPPIRRRITSGHCRWNPVARAFPFAESPPKSLVLLLRPIASH